MKSVGLKKTNKLLAQVEALSTRYTLLSINEELLFSIIMQLKVDNGIVY